MTDAQLNAPYAHVVALPSKNLRGRFIDAANAWMSCPPEHVARVKAIVDRLHNASLLLDDIEDGSVRRRGQPAAHTIFGTPLTMNCANIVIFEAMADVAALRASLPQPKEAPTCHEHYPVGSDAAGAGPSSSQAPPLCCCVDPLIAFNEEMLQLHRGQGRDIYWRDTGHCPTVDAYRGMVVDKTGGLFRLALRLMWCGAVASADAASGACAQRHAQFRALCAACDDMSFLFQILDDYLNLCSTQYHEKKTFCEDLSEGKFSFLTTHAINTAAATGDQRLLRTLQQKPTDVERKQFCLRLLRETGSFAYTHTFMHTLGVDVVARLRALAAAPGGSDDDDGEAAAGGPPPVAVASASDVQPMLAFVRVLLDSIPPLAAEDAR